MPVQVAQRISRSLFDIAATNPPLSCTIIWHGGEPLASGYDHFVQLVQAFWDLEHNCQVRHSIQTNATMVDERWCKLFMQHHFLVGVSIDGPVWANRNRVNWSGAETYSRTMQGIATLQRMKVPFDVVAVVDESLLKRAAELYEFFLHIGCESIGINIEEMEGENRKGGVRDDVQVKAFWEQLYAAWRQRPNLNVREIDYTLAYLNRRCLNGLLNSSDTRYLDIFPTIGWNGDVVVLSPELHGARSETYHDFVVGNVLEDPLAVILERAEQALYVKDYLIGRERCRTSCPYFSFCGGGEASNKFYEFGTTNSTETTHCLNSRQRLFDAIVTKRKQSIPSQCGYLLQRLAAIMTSGFLH